MRVGDYIRDQAGVLLLNGAGMLFLSIFLLASGNHVSVVVLILIAWILVLAAYFGGRYLSRRKYFQELQQLLEELDERYLLAEVMKPSWRLEDRIYQEILRKSNKSVIEKIHQLEEEQREYKEYIESWIHEAKTPITAMNLICKNLSAVISCNDLPEAEDDPDGEVESDGTGAENDNCPDRKNTGEEYIRRLEMELGKMENQVEMVLYHARMEQAYQDYLIKKTQLRPVVLDAIRKNRIYFLENRMQISLQMEEVSVSTDEKWVLFLLNQIFSNCIKYRRESGAQILIYTKRQKRSLSLIIEDNGCGIKPEEIGRIFQKGFCGSNGRKNQRATGMGLYLCKRLCDKLEIGIHAESQAGQYTRMILTFPDSDFNALDA